MGALTHNGEVLQRLPANASQINFDKTGTNLNSTQVENAIKEVNTKVNTNTTDIDQLKSGLIKHTTETVSGTTNSSGVLISTYGANTKLVTCYMEDYMAIPYINGGVWKFVICDSSSTSGIVQIKNTAVSVNVVIETVG